MAEQDQLLQKILAANDTDNEAEDDRGDTKAALSMKVSWQMCNTHSLSLL